MACDEKVSRGSALRQPAGVPAALLALACPTGGPLLPPALGRRG
ncbi:MAG: hypothetical protein ACLRWQ_20675 [Flavonifractor plautii]